MRIDAGLSEGCVVPLRHGDAAPVNVSGSCRTAGRVHARVDDRPSAPVGQAGDGRWTACIPRLRAGGPYRVEFRIGPEGREHCQVRRFYAGDLWVLAGQSNMAGAGAYVRPEPPSPPVRVFDKTERWRVASDPLDGGNRRKSTGLGVRFGKELYARTGIPVGLIPCARGSSSMRNWQPDAAPVPPETEALYPALLRRVRACGGSIRGILWYQGESDATPDTARAYPRALRAFIERLRADLGRSIPVLLVQIGRVLTFEDDPNLLAHTEDAWDAVRCAQERLARTLPNTEMTTAVDLELDNKIHHSSEALKRLGTRLAILAARRAYRVPGIRPGPRIVRVRCGMERGEPVVDIRCSGVNGSLQSKGRPAGFTVFDRVGRAIPVIKTRILGRTTVRLFLHGRIRSGTLWYGRGMDPVCTLHDTLDLPLPAGGPWLVRASTPGPMPVFYPFQQRRSVAGFSPARIHAWRRTGTNEGSWS